eukprot:Phypoly_transcript_10958.p1 GENE.Phypoly_transcript_10958~~Phypoly_transcript_10958.p1  ORF type:complete len:252 (+),score=27.19 Phypoly_transcript_10958:429-1184(+)
MPAKTKNKGSWRQFDKKGGGGGGGDGTKIKTIIISTFFGLTALISFVLIVISFSQVGQHGKPFNGDTDICNLNDTQKPIRLVIPKADAAPTDAPTDPPSADVRSHTARFDPKEYFLNKHVLECPWPTRNAALRILANILGLATCICVFWLVMHKEVWQSFWVCLISCLVLVVFIFAIFVHDATTLSNGKKYCESQAVDLTASPSNTAGVVITCNMSPQIAIGVLNVVWLLWIVDALLLYLYVKKWKVVIYS